MQEFFYIMKSRPLGIGCQPVGHTRYIERDRNQDGYYGIVMYPFELTESERNSFELQPLNITKLKKGDFFKYPNNSNIFQFIKIDSDNYGDITIYLINQTNKTLIDLPAYTDGCYKPIQLIDVEIKEVSNG